MAKKSLGHVELEWVCPNCQTRNPGPVRVCTSCGSPQPEDVQFEQPAQEKLLEDEAKIAAAKAGPDIHCYYCGTRNPAAAETCSQCGAPLTEGAARASGQILGAHRTAPAEPIECPNCGTSNEPGAANCVQCGASLVEARAESDKAKRPPTPAPKPARRSSSRLPMLGLIGLGVLILAACITFFVLSNRTEDMTGTADSVSWTRTITIEELVPVEYETWEDQIPAEGIKGYCRNQVRRTQDQPAPGAREVCGTPYTVDTGGGFGEVVQDCQYEILEPFCEYTADEWRPGQEVTLSGDDFSPQWPQLNLNPRQARAGERDEIYRCIFRTESGTYTYATSNPDILERCQPGSRWLLKVNTFNAVTDIEPLE